MASEAGFCLKLVESGDLSHFGLKVSRRAQESMAFHNLAHRRVSSEADSVKVILRKEQREQGVLGSQKEPQEDKVIEGHFLEQQGVFQAASSRGFIAAGGGGGS